MASADAFSGGEKKLSAVVVILIIVQMRYLVVSTIRLVAYSVL